MIHPETVRRLACDGRVQTVLEDPRGQPVRLGRMTREPPAWMLRQLKYRDRECAFPGCGAHLDNLVLVCTFHHRLVHEYRWKIKGDPDGEIQWFLPDGTRYRTGPGPPAEKT